VSVSQITYTMLVETLNPARSIMLKCVLIIKWKCKLIFTLECLESDALQDGM